MNRTNDTKTQCIGVSFRKRDTLETYAMWSLYHSRGEEINHMA